MTAWELTRAVSPRPWVRVADTMVGGGVSGTYRTVRSTDETTPPEGPWAVLLADSERRFRLVCLDLDAGGDDAVGQLVPYLDAAGIPHLVTASGQPGHRHIWWAIAGRGLTEAEARDLAIACRGLVPATDITPLSNPATGCVRPPGAPHASGGVSEVIAGELSSLMDPRVTRAQVRALTISLADAAGLATEPPTPPAHSERTVAKDSKGRPYLPGSRRQLPPSAAQALSHRVSGAEDASPVQWTVLLGAARAHWTFNDVHMLLAAAPGLEHSRTRPLTTRSRIRLPRPKAEQHRILATEWARAVEAAAAHVTYLTQPDTTADLTARAHHVTQTVDTVLERVATTPGRWIRRSGASDLRVLKVLSLITLDALALDIEADVRTIALRAGIGRQTVSNALARLTDDGWIQRTTPASGPHGARWRLLPSATPPTNHSGEKSHPCDSTETKSPTWTQRLHRGVPHSPNPWLLRSANQRRLRTWLTSATHDLFTNASTKEGQGLGPHLGNVYALVLEVDEPITVMKDPSHSWPSKLRGKENPSQRRYLLRHLRSLTKLKLLRHVDLRSNTGNLTVAGYRRDPRDRIARQLGLTGILEMRATRYRTERLLWNWWSAEQHWMNTSWSRRWTRPVIGQTSLLQDTVFIWPPYPRHQTRGNHRQARHLIGQLQPHPQLTRSQAG